MDSQRPCYSPFSHLYLLAFLKHEARTFPSYSRKRKMSQIVLAPFQIEDGNHWVNFLGIPKPEDVPSPAISVLRRKYNYTEMTRISHF